MFAQVGSYSYDMNRMVFDVSTLGYIQQSQSITLDYKITINELKKQDQLFNGGALGNFSLAGFEMVRCDKSWLRQILFLFIDSQATINHAHLSAENFVKLENFSALASHNFLQKKTSLEDLGAAT